MKSCNKQHLRTEYRAMRGLISQERRMQAKQALLSELYPRLAFYRNILSFHGVDSEIDTSLLNCSLAQETRLILPKVEGTRLALFHVTSLNQQLSTFSWRGLEPIPEACSQCPLERIDCILVPALAFDSTHMRIGQGKGHYDRLIAQARAARLPIAFIGLGFKEQLVPQALPCEPHDQSLDILILV
jgi:5-formyltetrahydrofolate cyclo-ligase